MEFTFSLCNCGILRGSLNANLNSRLDSRQKLIGVADEWDVAGIDGVYGGTFGKKCRHAHLDGIR